MKMNPSIALFAVSALLAGAAGAQKRLLKFRRPTNPNKRKKLLCLPNR